MYRESRQYITLWPIDDILLFGEIALSGRKDEVEMLKPTSHKESYPHVDDIRFL